VHYRTKTLLPAVFAVSLALHPGLASAQQSKLRGYLFTRSSTVRGITGSCECQWKWYTVGLRPGTVRITATARQDGPIQAPTYAVLVSLQRGGTSVSDGQVACDVTAKHCSNVLHMRASISQPGVYYILVHGEGSISIAYNLNLSGNVYPLHCRQYCR